jgi:hypothetical protein
VVSWKRPGQSEGGKHALVEACDGRDLVAGQGEHEEPHGVEHPPAGIADVQPEGGLAICPRRDDAVPPPLVKSHGREEAGGRLAPVVLERRHRELDVLAQEGHDRVNVARFESARQLLDEPPLGLRVRRRGGSRPLRAASRVRALPGRA